MKKILKILLLFALFISFSSKGQTVYEGNVKNKDTDFKNTNEPKNIKTTYQLFLFDNNDYKLVIETYISDIFKGRRNLDCFTINGKWMLKDSKLTLSSNGFNNIHNYILVRNKIYLIDENGKKIKSHKLVKRIKYNLLCE